jgi:tetratricopeptide (TPR) repeat protein
MKSTFFGLFCFIALSFSAQQFANKNFYLVDSLILTELTQEDKKLIDSTLNKFHKSKIDTTQILHVFEIIDNCYNNDVWPKYNQWVLHFIDTKIKSSSKEKLPFYEIKKSDALNNIGYLYQFKGNIPFTLEYYHKALKIREKHKDTSGISNSFINIGLVYYEQGDYPNSLKYYFKSLELRLIQGDNELLFNVYNNIATTYKVVDSLEKAIIYYAKCLEIIDEIGNNRKKSLVLNNLSALYQKQDNLTKALDFALQSLTIRKELNDPVLLSQSYVSVAHILFSQGTIKGKNGALENALMSHEIALDLNYPAEISKSALCLSEIYAQLGDAIAALEMYKLYIEKRDEIKNIETDKATIKSELQYEYEKKAAADSVANAKDKIIKDAEIAKQKAELSARRNMQYGLFGGIILILLFVFILFNRLKISQKQKKIIERKEQQTQIQNEIISRQKLVVEENALELAHKHKEITDSINYAERIQRSFLASKELLDNHLQDYFVLFQPKDVVSGDFYWAASTDSATNQKFVYCCADSTGHGVPGAIMSILNISSLEKAFELNSSPEEILNSARKIIIERLKKDGSENGGKDGMDCALIALDASKRRLDIACAQNPVWIVRNQELIEIKGDKMPVGKHDNDTVSFTLHSIDVFERDVIYCSTDGFPDQFGGEKGKKFMSKQLKELLVQISSKPMFEQQIILTQTFNDWKVNHEQIDDVCIIGVRI